MDINTYLITEIEKLGQPPSGHSSKHGSNKKDKEIMNAYHKVGDAKLKREQNNYSQ